MSLWISWLVPTSSCVIANISHHDNSSLLEIDVQMLTSPKLENWVFMTPFKLTSWYRLSRLINGDYPADERIVVTQGMAGDLLERRRRILIIIAMVRQDGHFNGKRQRPTVYPRRKPPLERHEKLKFDYGFKLSYKKYFIIAIHFREDFTDTT